MAESPLATLAIFAVAIILLVLGVLVLFARKGQPLTLDVRGFGVTVRLERQDDLANYHQQGPK